MKKLAFALLATTTILFSCSKNNDGNPNTASNGSETALKAQLQASTWDVHYFNYNTDQTKKYAGYTFAFKADSTLVVTDLSESYNGGWNTAKRADGSTQLTINILSLTPIQLLNNTWKVTANTGTMITLRDYNNTNNAELQLQKH